jgi:hypothetical protein
MDKLNPEVCLDYAIVEEADELQGIVDGVVESGGKAANSVHDRYKQIVSAIANMKPGDVMFKVHFLLSLSRKTAMYPGCYCKVLHPSAASC